MNKLAKLRMRSKFNMIHFIQITNTFKFKFISLQFNGKNNKMRKLC